MPDHIANPQENAMLRSCGRTARCLGWWSTTALTVTTSGRHGERNQLREAFGVLRLAGAFESPQKGGTQPKGFKQVVCVGRRIVMRHAALLSRKANAKRKQASRTPNASRG